MTLFDLLFILVFLTALIALLGIGIAAVRGRRQTVRLIGRRLGVGLLAYVVVIALVGIASPKQFVALGADQCSDDWCIAADSVHRDAAGDTIVYTIDFRLSSRARGVAQRERSVVAFLVAADGRRFDASHDSAVVPFDTLLQPTEVIRATRRFSVPRTASDVGLVIAREGGTWFPRCCIIGDANNFMHRRPIVRLE